MVAELPLFDGCPYPASVRAVDQVVTNFINKSDFQQRHLVSIVESMTFGA